MMVVRLQQQSIICSSPVSRVSGNAGIDYGGGGSPPVPARTTAPIGTTNGKNEEVPSVPESSSVSVICMAFRSKRPQTSTTIPRQPILSKKEWPTSIVAATSTWPGKSGENIRRQDNPSDDCRITRHPLVTYLSPLKTLSYNKLHSPGDE